jgi:thiamine biosynthesis lipoprotein
MNSWKNALYSLGLLLLIMAVWWWRNRDVPEPIKVEGATMGTTYHVTYFDRQNRNFKRELDSVLVAVNKAINNYDTASEVSRFNRSAATVVFKPTYFPAILMKAREIVAGSNGAFDPTVMPLVNAWGFGPDKQQVPDSAKVDSLRQMVGFEKILLTEESVSKTDPRVQIDFGGIGQGFGADALADFLRTKGVTNMLVELGGEGMAVGRNLKTKQPWELGILDPASTYDNQFFKAYVKLENQSFTTSGNYFNYRIIDGQKFSHTINPETGYPVEHELLSASIFAKDATTADGWATACMVAGLEQAKKWMADHPELQAFFIYSTPGGVETYATPGIKNQLTIQP